MKQNINFSLPICVGYDLDLVEKIEFVFRQKNKYIKFTYPNDDAVRLPDTDIVILHWLKDYTCHFVPGLVEMDTRISLKGVFENPETEVQTFELKKSLFKRGE